MWTRLTAFLLLATAASGAERITTPWRMIEDDKQEYAAPDLDDRTWATIERLPMLLTGKGTRWYRTKIQLTGQEAIAIPPLFGDYELFLNGSPLGERVDWYPTLQPFQLPARISQEATLAIRVRPFAADLYQLERIAPHNTGEVLSGTAAELSLLANQTRSTLVLKRMPGLVMWGFQQALVLFLLRLAVRMKRAEAGVFGGILVLLGSYYLLEEATVREAVRISDYQWMQNLIAAAFYGLEFAFIGLYLELQPTVWLRSLPFVVTAIMAIAPNPALPIPLQVGCAAMIAAHWNRPQSRQLAIAFGPVVAMLFFSAIARSGLASIPLSVQVAGITVDLSSLATLWFMISLTITLADRSTEAQRYQDRVARELAAGALVQNASLRTGLEQVEGMQIRHAYLPAQEVGGDFYQVKALPGGEALVLVGDVSGKGLSAALVVSELLGAFRALSATQPDPAALLTALNGIVCDRKGQGFVTACCIRMGGGRVRIANAGHLPPFIDGLEWQSPSDLPLGVVKDLPYEAQECPGQKVLLLTDGVAEARNAAGDLFGFDRTAELLSAGPEALAAAAAKWGQEDDITILELTSTQSG